MAEDLVGCRSWVKGLPKALNGCLCLDLNVSNEEFEWGNMPTKKGLTPEQLAVELAEQSVQRLETYFRYYYTSHGKKRETDPSDDSFEPELKSSRAVWENFIAQLPYLLPEGIPGPEEAAE
ncbi:hypothetical protein M422DRAFT_56090 [Sphaerobolus stellatus SS14]|uniref:Uncharacterized protein n=1 Tax=Sphaerobolus stellatus (strain SS14) TaxID=990650 RepID=A0A0C9T849_SPHS4|nr:hypothetical protein M422DRAFT_56090 [Sphaerobolus stellatus SS14]